MEYYLSMQYNFLGILDGTNQQANDTIPVIDYCNNQSFANYLVDDLSTQYNYANKSMFSN